MMRSMMDGIWNNRVEPHGEITEKRQTVRKDGTQSQGAKAGTTERTQPSQPSCQNFNLKSERKIEKMAKKKLQKLFAILLAGSMTMGIASTAALAVEYDLEQGSVYVDNDQDGEGDYSWQKTRDEVTKDTADRTYVKEDTSNDGKIIINQGVDSKSGSEKEATTNTVQVGENVQGVTITLDDVNVQAGEGESAVEIGAGSNVQIEVSGENILKGGTNGAGIAVPGKVVLDDTVPDEAEPGDAVLNLSSDKAGGTLTAIGNGGVDAKGTSGAGIGGTKENGTSGKINIDSLDGLTAEDYIAFPDEQVCRVGAPTTHEMPEEEVPVMDEGVEMPMEDAFAEGAEMPVEDMTDGAADMPLGAMPEDGMEMPAEDAPAQTGEAATEGGVE